MPEYGTDKLKKGLNVIIGIVDLIQTIKTNKKSGKKPNFGTGSNL